MIKKLFCAVLVLQISSICAQKFTIPVIPDPQKYTDYRYQTATKKSFPINLCDTYKKQMSYILDHIDDPESPFVCVLHLGDNVSHQNKKKSEWILAEEVVSMLDDKIPLAMVPGNHDYDVRKRKYNKEWYYTFYGDKNYTKYFGDKSKHFADKKWYIDSFNGGMSSVVKLKIKGNDYLFLCLEMEPGDAVLTWAQKVIDSNFGIPTILITHNYLNWANEKGKNYASRFKSAYRRDYDSNSGQKLWEKFIKKNNQIFMVLSGHSYSGCHGENSRIDLNDFGFPVYQFVSDYEGRREIYKLKNGRKLKVKSGGWMRLLDFDIGKKTVHVRTYNPQLEKYELDEDSDMIINFDWDWGKRFLNFK